MNSAAAPKLIVLGQVTVDDVVPATPGIWRRQIGGSSLYAAAGARLWLDPADIGVVARIGRDYPFDLERLLREAGLRHIALQPLAEDHLVEWLIYEPDGSRRSLPRNPSLLSIGAEGARDWSGYQNKLLAIAPTAQEIPASWLPAPALHLCPQVGARHRDALAALRGRTGWLSVDPSPHYSRDCSIEELARMLHGATAFLPSSNEISALIDSRDAGTVVLDLHRAGFAEVALKRGAQSVLLAADGTLSSIPVQPTAVVDPTGAGDSFCGAYAACRLLGHTPPAAARRAAATAARIVGCSGVEQALSLMPA